MNLKVILASLLLAMLTSQVFSCSSGSVSCTGTSPAGGPGRNPQAVVCTSYRNANKVTCKLASIQVTCDTQPTVETRDDRYGGPTPRGEYLIGKRYKHSRKNIDWYNLYPKKEDNCGYYGYNQRTKKGRYALALHPGMVSLGCVVVKTPLYDRDSCWQRIRRLVDTGNMSYRGSGYSGFMYAK